MSPDLLQAAVREDRAAGRRPFLVVGSAGTINTGAVDPLNDIADVAADEDLWFHVDGAYGGFFQLTDRGRAALDGIERADTITLDPHKGLFLPYGTGCLLARDATALRAAHEERAHYLPPVSQDDALPDFSSFSPELTRDYRGLRLWLPLHLHGVDTFVQALDEKLDLAGRAYQRLTEVPALDVPVEAAAVDGRVQATRGQRPGDRWTAAPHQREQPGLALLGCGRRADLSPHVHPVAQVPPGTDRGGAGDHRGCRRRLSRLSESGGGEWFLGGSLRRRPGSGTSGS